MSEVNTKDVFSGAEIAYKDYFCCIRTFIEKYGEEETFALMTKADQARGEKAGKEIREELGGKDLSLSETMHTIIELAKGIGGIDTILEDTPECAATVTGFGKCPVYEAAKEAGMEDGTIETMCRAASLVFLDQVVKQLNPNLTYRLRAFRSEEFGGCVEEIVPRNENQ